MGSRHGRRTVTLSELASIVAKRTGIRVDPEAKVFTQVLFGTIAQLLHDGYEVALGGFGDFRRHYHSGNTNYDVLNRRKLRVPSYWMARFKAAKHLKRYVNDREERPYAGSPLVTEILAEKLVVPRSYYQRKLAGEPIKKRRGRLARELKEML